MSDEEVYTKDEIEAMLELPCCHITGTHNPRHYIERKYICQDQVAEAFHNLVKKLGLNPVVKHSEDCLTCSRNPDKTGGDGMEYWNHQHYCKHCGRRQYRHKRERENERYECQEYREITYEDVLDEVVDDE